MKKGWKIFWSVCGSLFVLGIVLTIAGFVLGATWDIVGAEIPDWIGFKRTVRYQVEKDYEYGETIERAEETYSFEQIKRIEVEAEVVNLQILVDESLKNEVKVEVEDSDFAKKLNLLSKNDTLMMETNNKLSASDRAGTVWMYIPDTSMREVEIDVDAGSVYIQKIACDNLSVSVSAGEALIQEFQAGNTEFECGAGRIQATGDYSQELEASCGAGELELMLGGAEEEYNYEVEYGIGEVTIGEEHFAGMGSKQHHSPGAKKEMHIECGIGRIKVEFL